MMTINDHLPTFICGPLHGQRIPEVIWALKPAALTMTHDVAGTVHVYLINWWNTKPAQGFYYYAWRGAGSEDILDQISLILESQ